MSSGRLTPHSSLKDTEWSDKKYKANLLSINNVGQIFISEYQKIILSTLNTPLNVTSFYQKTPRSIGKGQFPNVFLNLKELLSNASNFPI